MISIYIANLGAYNRGHLIGSWVTLPMDEVSLQEKINAILAEGDHQAMKHGEYCGPDEEVAIHDYECDFDGVEISEYSSIRKLNELAQTLDNLADWELDEVKAVIAATNYDLEDSIRIVEERRCTILHGIDSTEDLGYYAVDEGLFGITIPESLRNYIDYESIGRDMEFDYTIVHSLGVAVYVQ